MDMTMTLVGLMAALCSNVESHPEALHIAGNLGPHHRHAQGSEAGRAFVVQVRKLQAASCNLFVR